MTGEDCKPNKALRTTIKVFLRTEEKKREALRLKEAKLSTPPTTAPAVPAPVIDDAVAPTAAGAVTQSKSEEVNREEQTSVVDQEQTPVEEPAKDHVAAAATESTEADQDVPQPSIEVRRFNRVKKARANFVIGDNPWPRVNRGRRR